MVARFYHPSLSGGVLQLDEQASQVASAVAAVMNHLGLRHAPGDEFDLAPLDAAKAARDDLRDLVEAFQESLAREAARYV
jgi:hypothetical protein